MRSRRCRDIGVGGRFVVSDCDVTRYQLRVCRQPGSEERLLVRGTPAGLGEQLENNYGDRRPARCRRGRPIILNFAEGVEQRLDGQICIKTTAEGERHALFGPYIWLDPGKYVVTFSLAKAEQNSGDAPNLVCAILDVAADAGREVLATEFILLKQLATFLQPFDVPFELDERRQVEFRVRGTGKLPIIIADNAAAAPRQLERTVPSSQAPDCALVRETPGEIVNLFCQGRSPKAVDGGFHFAIDGIVVAAEQRDDVNFVDEVFDRKAYNLDVARDQCVIDIGMNVGLTSLVFAARERVKEVHAFEPFASTYQKALTNLALNPSISAKIRAVNAGLSDRDEQAVVFVPETNDSGSRSTFDVAGGTPVALTLLDAATTLRPIIVAARRLDRFVLAKVDCEGSEFPIFSSLEAAGLLAGIDAFMVEWHRVVPGKDVHDLTRPLLMAGFTVIDLSPREGNGFFYAVRSEA